MRKDEKIGQGDVTHLLERSSSHRSTAINHRDKQRDIRMMRWVEEVERELNDRQRRAVTIGESAKST